MPKTREQCQEIKDERRESIINTCISLFAFHDYQSISVDTITNTAKCSHGLFYHYFSSKEHVLDATLQKACNDIDSLVYSKDNMENPPLTRLSNIMKAIEGILSSSNDQIICELYLLLNLHLKCDSLIKSKTNFKPKNKPLFHLVFELIEQGQKENVFDGTDPKEYTIALMSMIKGLAYNRLHLGHKKFICPRSEILMNIVCKR